MGGDDYELEIDLTVETADGLVPIRWVGPHERTGTNGSAGKGNGQHPLTPVSHAAGSHGSNGHGSNGNGSNGNGHGPSRGAVVVPTFPVPRVASLASFIPEAVPVLHRAPEARVIEVLEPDVWHAVPSSVTVRRVMASRGARFLTVVAVVTVVSLLAAVVALWQRVEEPHRPTAPTELVNAPTKAQMRAVENRLNRLETRLTSLVDPNGSIANSPEADIFAYQLQVLRSCVSSFQAAIAAGRVRGGQFAYC